jgi:hypothetical protein
MTVLTVRHEVRPECVDEVTAARELQQQLARCVVGEPPAPQPLDVVGSYRLFG